MDDENFLYKIINNDILVDKLGRKIYFYEKQGNKIIYEINVGDITDDRYKGNYPYKVVIESIDHIKGTKTQNTHGFYNINTFISINFNKYELFINFPELTIALYNFNFAPDKSKKLKFTPLIINGYDLSMYINYNIPDLKKEILQIKEDIDKKMLKLKGEIFQDVMDMLEAKEEEFTSKDRLELKSEIFQDVMDMLIAKEEEFTLKKNQIA